MQIKEISSSGSNLWYLFPSDDSSYLYSLQVIIHKHSFRIIYCYFMEVNTHDEGNSHIWSTVCKKVCERNALFVHVGLILLSDHQYWVCIQVEAHLDQAVLSVQCICNYKQCNKTEKTVLNNSLHFKVHLSNLVSICMELFFWRFHSELI